MYGYPQIGIDPSAATTAQAANARQVVCGYPQFSIDAEPERPRAEHASMRSASGPIQRLRTASRARCVYSLGRSRGASRAVCGAPLLVGEPLQDVVSLGVRSSLAPERVERLGHPGVCLALDEEPLPTAREVRGQFALGHGQPRGLLEARGAQYGTPLSSVASVAPSRPPCAG